MLSAQMNEQDSNVEPPAQEPKLRMPSTSTGPDGPKGSAARKWIVLLVIVAVVGAAVNEGHGGCSSPGVSNVRLGA